MLIKEFMPGDMTKYYVGLSLVKPQTEKEGDFTIAYMFGTEYQKRIGIFTISKYDIYNLDSFDDYVQAMSINEDHYNSHSIWTGYALLTYFTGMNISDELIKIHNSWSFATEVIANEDEGNIIHWLDQIDSLRECIIDWSTQVC